MLCIQFGPYCLGLETSSEFLAGLLSIKFEKHITNGEPDLAFEVVLDESTPEVSVREISISQLNDISISGRRFAFVQDMITGEFKIK